MNGWVKRALIAVPVAVALFFGAILLYVNVIRPDAPDELSTSDLSAAVGAVDTTTPDSATGTATATAPTASKSPATDAAVSSAAPSVTTAPLMRPPRSRARGP